MSDIRPYSVTVIVVAYQGDDWMEPCLLSLRSATIRPMKLVLVDNAGNQHVDRWPVTGFDCQIFKTDRPMGFTEANNFALQQSKPTTDVVCFLNQDTKSEPGWLDACLKCMEENPQIGAMTPPLRTYDWSEWDKHFLECARHSPQFMAVIESKTNPEPFYVVDRVTGAAMLVRTSVLKKIGPFDPIFVSYYEDYDFCLRVRECGYKVAACGSGAVAHFAGSSTITDEARRKRMRQVIRNRAILRFREAGPRRMQAVLKCLFWDMPYTIARAMARTASSQPFTVVCAAYFDLLRLLPRIITAHRDREAWNRYLDSMGWAGHRTA